jgi:hypothetical protein
MCADPPMTTRSVPSPTAAAFSSLREDDPAGLAQVIALGMAEVEVVQRESRETLSMIASTARDQMLKWAAADGLPDGVENNLVYFIGVFGTHYAAAMDVLVKDRDVHSSAALSTSFASLDALEKKEETVSDPALSDTLLAQGVIATIVDQLLGAWMAIAITHVSNLDAEHASIVAQGIAKVAMLYEPGAMLADEMPLVAKLAARLASETAPALVRALSHEDRRKSKIAGIGYHALNTIDLTGLSQRERTLREKYGVSIERAFERQLALLFTSFGYAVIESVPGKRQVDLLCVAASPQPATIVVEAKTTTAREYSLPATHERALNEHVEEVRKNLRGLPPLRLILVVAPRFSEGAARRLEAVGRRQGVAVTAYQRTSWRFYVSDISGRSHSTSSTTS